MGDDLFWFLDDDFVDDLFWFLGFKFSKFLFYGSSKKFEVITPGVVLAFKMVPDFFKMLW